MKNRFWLLLLSAVLVFRGTAVYADVADYQTVTQEEQKENKTIQTFVTDDGQGNSVKVAACSDILYVTARQQPSGQYPVMKERLLQRSALGMKFPEALGATITGVKFLWKKTGIR